jgi:hypothetical protein
MKRTLLFLSAGLIGWQGQAQDQCSTALAIGLGTYTVDYINGTEIPLPICAFNGFGATNGEWYSFTADGDTTITVSTDLPQNFGGDTRFHVYTGVCGSLVCHAGDDDSGAGLLSKATFDVSAGTTYIIAFDDRWLANGFDFEVYEDVPPPPPPPTIFTAQPLPISGFGLAIVDMNSDGLDDVVGAGANLINIHYQLDGGGFEEANIITATATHTPGWSMCAGDLDGNGFNDLMYGSGQGVSLMMANEDGTAYDPLNQTEYIFCQRTNMVDLNNDGHLDAFSCHDVAPNCWYQNDGNNNFVFHQGGLGDTPDGGNYGSIWVDYDNDHDVDMFIAKCRGAGSPASIDQLHRNNGDGTFTDVAPGMNLADFQQSWSSAWGDFDNDGDMDVLIGASSFTGGGHKLMRNDGTTFTNVTAGSGFDLYTGMSIEYITQDFNNDGWLDIMGGDGFFLSNGDMTFTEKGYTGNNGPVGDVNNDGFLDVFYSNTLYLNNGNDSNWVRVRTVGTVSNANGIGARVQVTSPLGTQIRDIRSGDGFRYMSSLFAHFGLGADTEISNITVYWPSGLVSSINDPDINTTLTIVEGDINTNVSEVEGSTFSLFPNPAVDVLRVRSTEDLNGHPATITDLAGKLIARTTLRNGAVNVSSLKSGTYIMQVLGSDGVLNGRFVKQ